MEAKNYKAVKMGLTVFKIPKRRFGTEFFRLWCSTSDMWVTLPIIGRKNIIRFLKQSLKLKDEEIHVEKISLEEYDQRCEWDIKNRNEE